MEALDLGEALLDALILRVAPPPCGDAPLLRPLSHEAPRGGERSGPGIIGIELFDEAAHGDTEPEGRHLEASLALGAEQLVQLALRPRKPGFDLLRFIKPPVILFAATSTILSSSLAHLEMFDSAVPTVFEAY